MSHYVFSATGDCNPTLVGVAMNVTEDEADRIAVMLTRDRSAAGMVYFEVEHTEVPAYTPKSIREGDVVSGRVANTLPRGTAIARVSRVDGVAVKVSSALLLARDGWVSGTDTADCPGGQINEEARYEVLFLGEPYGGPVSTAARR